MRFCASPDAPAEVLCRHARGRADKCAAQVAESDEQRRQRAEKAAAEVEARADRRAARTSTDPLTRLVGQFALPDNVTAVFDAVAATADQFIAPIHTMQKAIAISTKHHAQDLEARAARAAQDTAALDALAVDAPVLALVLEVAPPAPRTTHDLPPPGQAVRSQPLAAHAPPTSAARGCSRRWDKGTPLDDRRRY